MSEPFPPLRDRRSPTLLEKTPGRWTARYRHRGKTRDVRLSVDGERTSHGNPPARVARAFERDHVRPYLAGEWSPWTPPAPAGDDHTLTTFAEARAAFLSRYDRSPETRRTYDSVLGLLESRLPPHALAREVTAADVAAFLDRDGVTASTRRHGHRHLSAFFRWAVRDGVVDVDPMARVDKPRGERRARAFAMPTTLEGLFADVAKIEPAAVVDALRFSLAAGFRRGEIVAAQAADVDLVGGTVSVRIKTRAADGVLFAPKGRADRRVRLTPLAREIATEAVSRAPEPTSRLFAVKGRPLNPSRLSHAVRDARKGPTSTLTAHALRGHYVTYLLLLGWPVPLVQFLAGHADASTTLGYWRDAQSLLVGDGLERFRREALAIGFEAFGG